MKQVRKLLAIVLSIAIVIGLIPVANGKTNTKAAETFAITTPYDNALVASGHFDIKWSEATAKTVKSYSVFLDGQKVGSTQSTSMDCYTTKVEMHSAYVEAEYTDGTTSKADTIKFGVSKKGLGLAADMGRNVDLKDMGCSWYYNWGNSPSTGSQYKGVEFVPMLWKETNGNIIKNKVQGFVDKGYKYVLDFNEPDLGDQCNMSVDDVYNLWPSIMNDNINVSSPVTAIWPQSSKNWFQPFMEKINARDDLDVDFISIHCYPDDWDGGAEMADWFVKNVVDWAWETYHKPIWITEFSKRINNPTSNTARKTAEFWNAVMPLLDEREYVERYAGFCFNNANTGLWLYNTGELTLAGEMYRSNGNPAGYEPSVEPEGDSLYTFGKRTTILDDNVSVNGVQCTNYIRQDGVSVTASSENGNGGKASNAIDNNKDTRWESKHGSDNEYITVDLGSEKNVKQLQLLWEAASASDYTVEVSNDGENFTSVVTVTGGSGTAYRLDTVTLKTATKARYIKINCKSRTTIYGYSIYEMGIYGTDAAKVDETTTAETTTRRPYVTLPPADATETKSAQTTTEQSTTTRVGNTTTKTGETNVTTNEQEGTTVDSTTQGNEITTLNGASGDNDKSLKPNKAKVKKATKAKASKKVSILLKKTKCTKKFQIQISKSKKFKKVLVKKIVKKTKFTVKSKKLVNKKKLYVRARGIAVVNKKRVYGDWSKPKKIKVKK
ncbi:glycosyl hydrolase [uncultured Eubacterium sp.]|uniref:glycosyl hydrolase n=1 Tax=uncultured Eubacterium sp. TaxID=165185 RepID=UPI00260E3FA9|nr:glycosyl hydrolase [uncultured Eubacterium sp.]